jgi:tRNA U34 5-methylaminomethyl-2-thiouridine-forming methyltransferase MnmC
MEQLEQTADGSYTLRHPVGKTYHSWSGAVSESRHVFVEASGLRERLKQGGELRVMEVGYGTGLNFVLIGALAVAYPDAQLIYRAWEPEPPSRELCAAVVTPLDALEPVKQLALSLTGGSYANVTLEINLMAWPPLAPPTDWADIVVYDPFGRSVAPALWADEALLPAWAALRRGGCWVSYSVTGAVRRLAVANGYRAERLPGYPPKRQMLRVGRVS